MLREARFCDFPGCQRLADSACPLCDRDGCGEAHLDGSFTLNLSARLAYSNDSRTVTGHSLRVCHDCYKTSIRVGWTNVDDRAGAIPHIARDFMPIVITALRALLTSRTLKESELEP